MIRPACLSRLGWSSKEDVMETKTTSLRHRIPTEKRQECLKLFEQGYGYKKTAQLAGLNAYTVREYKRKYAAGDNSWAYIEAV